MWFLLGFAKTGNTKENPVYNTRKILRGPAASPFYIAENGVCASIRSDPNQEVANANKFGCSV
jgi:hypothetical protein